MPMLGHLNFFFALKIKKKEGKPTTVPFLPSNQKTVFLLHKIVICWSLIE